MSPPDRRDEAVREIYENLAETEPMSEHSASVGSIGYFIERVYRDDEYAYIVLHLTTKPDRSLHVRLPLLDKDGEIVHHGAMGQLLGAYIGTNAYERPGLIVQRGGRFDVVDASDMI